LCAGFRAASVVGMQFRILGPLEVWEDGRELEIGTGRQRALLALLLLHEGEIVSTDHLIDELWGERPPPSAAKVLQGYVSQLRRALPAATIDTRAPGYRLRAGVTDAAQFEQLLARAREQPATDAARTLRTALALWRGNPFADVEYEAWAQTEIARLEQLRLAALEARIEADLESGAPPALVAEIEALVAEYPLRERFRGHLMLALYRAGRQADALQAYSAARRKLVEELGIEPGPELQDLQRRILAQDTALNPPRSSLATVARRAPWLMLVGGLLLAGAATAAGLLLAGGGGGSGVGVVPNSVAVIDPGSNKVVRQISVGNTPTAVAVGDGAIWVLNSNEETLSRLDATQMIVVKSIGTGAGPIDLAVGAGAVWVAQTSHTLVRIDPSSEVAETSRIPASSGAAVSQSGAALPSWVASDGAAVWATNNSTVSRIEPKPQLSVAPKSLGCCGAVAVGAGSVWVTDDTGLLRLDARTGARQAHIDLPFASAGLVVAAGSVWATDQSRSAVWRIDVRNNAVGGTITVGDHPAGIAAGAGSLWVASGDGSVSRIDPAANRVTQTIHVGGTPNGVAVGAGHVWITVD
jgi:YVTN family beta-propeller protein